MHVIQTDINNLYGRLVWDGDITVMRAEQQKHLVGNMSILSLSEL